MSGKSSERSGLTAIELIVVTAIIGVLIAILVPAVLMAQEAARRVACANHFRQIGVAAASYTSAFGSFPPGEITPWTVALTLYFEQRDFYDAYDHRHDPFSDPANAALGTRPIGVLVCPSDVEVRVAPFDWISSNAAGNTQLLCPGSRPESCLDGLSTTGLCVEVSSHKGLAQIEGPVLYLGVEDAVHSGGFQLLLASGSVRLLSHQVSNELMQALGTPRGGEVVGGEF
ncbi:MAG TPA: DUF1559 domain-containing protein [Planctomycetaceae bacterium]|nr:DUF1559 domain-containing protein [Planctomycetaceae bacterium]